MHAVEEYVCASHTYMYMYMCSMHVMEVTTASSNLPKACTETLALFSNALFQFEAGHQLHILQLQNSRHICIYMHMYVHHMHAGTYIHVCMQINLLEVA